MELRKVQVEDIYPDDKNPRKDFGDIKALAASFDLNSLNPGEPVNPPVVVQDGGIYRIIDGERRYRGIKHNKLTSCHVIVCDDMDEANSMIAMLTTDDKQQLSDLERSRGVQQMLLLGVDPEKVDRVGRLSKGDAMRVNKAMLKVDDAAEDMTLDRLYAISEFADDPEAVEQLTDCPPNAWQRVAEDIRSQRRKEEELAEIKAACIALGLPIVPEEPEGFSYMSSVYSAEAVEVYFADGIPDDMVGVPAISSWRAGVELYVPIVEQIIDPETEAKNKLADSIIAANEDVMSRMATWYVEQIDDPDSTPHIDKFLLDIFLERGDNEWNRTAGDRAAELIEGAASKNIEDCAAPKMSGALAAYIYSKNITSLPGWACRSLAFANNVDSNDLKKYRRFVDQADALAADGYEPRESDIEIVGRCRQALIDAETAESEEKECE